MSVVLIPLKQGSQAKSRLTPLLSPGERVELIRHMLRDVAVAVDACRVPHATVLVSSDPWALDFSRRRGWRGLLETGQTSESESVDWASARLAGEGVGRVLRLPADVPLVTAADLEALLSERLARPGALLVPSRDGTGTNALLRSPPDAFPSCFGPDSRRLHERMARERGLALKILQNPSLELDIDTAADLAQLGDHSPGSSTVRFLRSRRILTRFGKGGQ